ncbi:S-adenosyl-L-methionine-dependent methyltransferase [Mycena capillaripes]|nr:S-adenosyl-L-methionine-dependent methyltransferase [Mycena capillaripes]
MESISTLRILLNILGEAVSTLERVYADAGAPLPSLDEPFKREAPSEALKQNPDVAGAVKNIMAAATQMVATVSDPVVTVINSGFAFHISSCLRVASEINIVEILREAGPKGAHVKDIAAPSGTDPNLIARILRLLATHYIFYEISPNVFTNNRISSALDKGKLSKDLFENRAERLWGTSGVAALVESITETSFRASAYLAETVLQPDEQKLPYNLAFNIDEEHWKFLQRPENTYRRERFAIGMRGMAASDPPELILQGMSRIVWHGNSGSVVVDCGGGIGHASLTIARKHPELRIITQDFAAVVELSKTHWKQNFPQHIDNGLVDFQVHDFFTAQPVENAAVFLLRYIIHDWNDAKSISILNNLRKAATKTTKLVLLEKIVPVASSGEEASHGIPGEDRPRAPYPLLGNWGPATAETYMYDMTVSSSFPGSGS